MPELELSKKINAELANHSSVKLWREGLTKGSSALGQDYSELQIERLIGYLSLLHRWNRAYNLTAIKDPEAMVIRHLLDSLAVSPYLQGQRFIDVGTGAGLPGLPLALVNEQRDFDLLDSNGKKIRFLFQVRTQLGIKNIKEIHQRVEQLSGGRLYDGILSRAYTSLSDMIKTTQHLLAPGGRFYALKGKVHDQEIAAVPRDYCVETMIRLTIPGLNEERHLIVIDKK